MIYSVPDPIILILGYIAVKYELFPNNARIQQNNINIKTYILQELRLLLKSLRIVLR